MSAIVDFPAARRRVEAQIEHEIEFTPRATLLDRYRRGLTDAQLAELVRVALEECK